MVPQDDFRAKSDAFIRWLLAHPSASINPKIALADMRAHAAGRGVVALAPLDEDEELFSVPRTSVMSVENSELPSKLPDIFQELDPWLALVLVLMYEFLLGPESRWKPYFDILPDTFDTLIFWSKEELDELQGSAVLDKIGKADADGIFRAKLWPVVKDHPRIFKTTSMPELDETAAVILAHRMASVIMAYAFDIESSAESKEVDEEGYTSEVEDEDLPKGLVPLADMLNADADKNNARLFYEPSCLSMRTLRPINGDEQLYNDYGSLPRSDMLRRYGYITPSYAQYDVVEVSTDIIINVAAEKAGFDADELQARVDYLQDQGVLEDGYDLCHMTEGAQSFPSELLALINTILLPGDHYERLVRRGSLPKPTVSAAVSDVLRQVAIKRRLDYPTTIEADQSMLEDPSLPKRKRLAIEVRLGEKQILEEVIRLAEQGSIATAGNRKRNEAHD